VALSEQEKADVRRHMGYGGVQQASTFDLGVPAGVQTAFLIEPAMQRLLPESEPVLRQYLTALNGVEQQILDDQPDYAAEKVGSITVNLREFQMLVEQYKYWQGNLGNLLQVPANPFDMRPNLGEGWSRSGGGMNAPVHH
jgi:hypothetical protein